ncbi:MAG: hypothetical protein L6R41_004600 [Letrouitia leprolyta]|nr:MAG: hypothetical protein L6R41_004600 [Letrouitia leprolyta]
MPEFLDLLFPLGERTVAQDFYSDCFYQRTFLTNMTRGLTIPERAWSGQSIKLCYSLKSVEPSESQTDWPWSIRHCATHHLFDVVNIRSTWVIIKGNQLMEKRMTSATSGRGPSEFSSYDSIDRAFAASLALHTVMIDWSGENWRWYINFLEEQFENLTKEAIAIDANLPAQVMDMGDLISPISRTNTQVSSQIPRLFRNSRRRTDTMQSNIELQPAPAQKYHVNPRTGKKMPLPPGRTIGTVNSVKGPTIQYDTYGQRQFGFQHLQDIQDLEESTNEVVLILKLNLNLYGLLEFQNTKSNKLLASASQKSTRRMEIVTNKMSEIARKTQTETVSMKIITLVTLFFLPGTFIATLMSTDIVHWTDDNKKTYQSGALQIYLALCIPFMVITFIFYAIFQWRERRKEHDQNEETRASLV